jgi:hypothetical protein
LGSCRIKKEEDITVKSYQLSAIGYQLARLSRRLTVVLLLSVWALFGADSVSHPFRGGIYIERVETAPRAERMHIVMVDLVTAGLKVKVTPPGGSMETVRQMTLDFLKQEHAQVAINAHYFLPFPSSSAEARLVGFAASDGVVYSPFQTPEQSYALVKDAPALNIDQQNHATIVHRDPAFADGKHVREKVTVWNAVSGSAQIVTAGAKTIPVYGEGGLTPGGPGHYTAAKSWYEQITARTAIGVTQDGRRLVLFTVDGKGGSLGMKVSEVADVLIKDFAVWDALNLDGGGSTSMAMEGDGGVAKLVNVSMDGAGRKVGSNLAVFAAR